MIGQKVNDVQTVSWGYDANNNRISENGELFATYDNQDRLISTTRQKAVPTEKITYQVDAFNRRIGKLVNDELQYQLVYKDKLNPIAKLNADGNVIQHKTAGASFE